jgi:hypothetical protein
VGYEVLQKCYNIMNLLRGNNCSKILFVAL